MAKTFSLSYTSPTGNATTYHQPEGTPQPTIPITPEAAIAGTTIGKAYFQNDHFGSPLFAANEQGEVLRYAERGPWGDLKVPVQEHLNWAGVGNSLLFTNYHYDPVIEKYFAQARFYDAEQGRMIALDPIRTGPNRYRYCWNNPTNYVDPDGEVATAVVVAIAIATEAIVGGAFRLMDYIRQQQEAGKRIDIKEARQALISGMGQGAWNGLVESISPAAALWEIGKIAVGIIGRAVHDKVTTGKIDIGNITREVLYDRYGGRPEPTPVKKPVVNSGTQGSLIEKTKAAIIPSPSPSVVPTVSRRDPKAGCERNVSGTGKGYDYGRVTPMSSLLDRWQDRWSDQNTMMNDLAMTAMVAGGGFGILKAGKAIGTVIRNHKNLVGVAGKLPGQVLGGKGGSNFSAGIHPGQITAGSKEINHASISRALRQSNTPEGMLVDKMLKRDIVKLNILDAHPKGFAGLKPHGNKTINIYKNATKTPQVAAGYTAHEAKHYLQKLTNSTYTKAHEYEAYAFQAKVDKSFPLNTMQKIRDFVNSHPAYKNLRD